MVEAIEKGKITEKSIRFSENLFLITQDMPDASTERQAEIWKFIDLARQRRGISMQPAEPKEKKVTLGPEWKTRQATLEELAEIESRTKARRTLFAGTLGPGLTQ
jgi:hypothetical protein